MSASPSAAAEPALALPAVRAARAAAGGVLAAAAVFGVLHWALVPGFLAVLLVLLLVVAVPVCRELPHRVATNLALLIGWAPLTWWVDWPVRVDHGATLAGLAAGGLAAYVLLAESPRARVRTLVPEVGRADLLLTVGGLAAVLAVAPLALARTTRQALLVLVPGADNWAHFAMFANMRANGATSDAVGPAPDGTPWGFGEYPKAFHGLVATWSEVMAPRMSTGASSILVYAHGIALVVFLGVVLVVAAALTLPGLRSRPLLALPAVVLTLAALLWEPGQKVLANGFATFWLGCVAAAAALLLGLAPRRTPVLVHVLAVAGLVVCVAQTWTPLAVVAGPAILMPFLSGAGRTARTRVRRAHVVLAVVLLLVAGAAAVKVLSVLATNVSVRFLLSEVSGFDGTSPLPTFVLLVVVVVLLARAGLWTGSSGSADPGRLVRSRVRLLGLAVALGVAALTTVLVLQLQILGTTSYYFLKFLVGFELILAGLVPALVVHVVGVLRPGPLPRRSAVLASVAAAVLVTQLVAPGWRAGALLWSSDDDGTAAVAVPYTRAGIVDGVLAALAAQPAGGSLDVDYLPVGRGNAVQIFYPDAWFHAADASVSARVLGRMAVLRVQADTDAEAASLARTLLEGDPRLTLLVPRDHAREVARLLGSDALGDRVRPVG